MTNRRDEIEDIIEVGLEHYNTENRFLTGDSSSRPRGESSDFFGFHFDCDEGDCRHCSERNSCR